MARNVTMDKWGVLSPGQYLIHDRDGKFCPAFQHTVDSAGVMRVVLPPRSPNLNAYAERWVRSVKEEALSRLILFGESSLRHVLNEYVDHYHHERIIRGRATCCSFLRQGAKVKARFSVANGSGGSLNTTSAKPHEFFDHTASGRSHIPHG